MDRAEKPDYPIPPTDGLDGDPGPSSQGQQNFGYHLKVSTLTSSQHQVPDRIKERRLIKEKTTYHHLHQVILVEIPTQMMMTMMITTKMEVMARAGEVDARNSRLENYLFPEMLLPVLLQCYNWCKVLVCLRDRQKTLRNLPIFFKGKITTM